MPLRYCYRTVAERDETAVRNLEDVPVVRGCDADVAGIRLRKPRMDGKLLMDPESIHQVEAALAAFPGLDNVCVMELDAEPVGRCLVAYVAPASVKMAALQAHARKLLPGRLVPTAIVATDASAVTAERQALPVPDLSGLVPYRAPDSARQAALCEIFADVLGVPRFGVDDDFFSLGGRSVDAMLLSGRISAALGVRMSIGDLFDAPTVAELDRRLDVTSAALSGYLRLKGMAHDDRDLMSAGRVPAVVHAGNVVHPGPG